MDPELLAQTSFNAQFRAALTGASTSSKNGVPALGTREEGGAPAATTVASTTSQSEPYNAGYDTGRGFVAAGGVALAVIILILLFAVVVTSRHHEHE